MQKISQNQKEKNCKDIFFKKCCVEGCTNLDIEWHHPLIYAGRQIADIVVPLCKFHHRGNMGTITREGKIYGEYYAITINAELLYNKYNKFDWRQRLKYLESQIKIL